MSERPVSRLTLVIILLIAIALLGYGLPKLNGTGAGEIPAVVATAVDVPRVTPLSTSASTNSGSAIDLSFSLTPDVEATAVPTEPVTASAVETEAAVQPTLSIELTSTQKPSLKPTKTTRVVTKPSQTPAPIIAPTVAPVVNNFNVDLLSGYYEPSPAPKTNCQTFDNTQSWKRFNVSLNIANAGSVDIVGRDWGVGALAGGRRAQVCYFGGGYLPDIPAGQAREVTLAIFVQQSERVTAIFVGTNGGKLKQFCEKQGELKPC